MKKILLSTMGIMFGTLIATAAVAEEVMVKLNGLQHEWAEVNYQVSDENKEAAFETLLVKAEALTQAYPQRSEPKVWEAIIRAGLAGSMGGVSSLFHAMPQMEKGRDLLLEAEQIDPKILNGSVYTTLGSFYYKVPGGFLGYGDSDKALVYLKKALEIAPEDMDANYFMGDFWLEKRQYDKARHYLEKVLAMPDLADRPVYSKGRKAEAQTKLAGMN